jgi:hypothetical protein
MSKRHRGFIENYRPRQATLDLIERVQAVLIEYAAHLPLTLRQIFYRLVGVATEDGSVGYEKTENAYKRLGEAVSKARHRSSPCQDRSEPSAVMPAPTW